MTSPYNRLDTKWISYKLGEQARHHLYTILLYETEMGVETLIDDEDYSHQEALDHLEDEFVVMTHREQIDMLNAIMSWWVDMQIDG